MFLPHVLHSTEPWILIFQFTSALKPWGVRTILLGGAHLNFRTTVSKNSTLLSMFVFTRNSLLFWQVMLILFLHISFFRFKRRILHFCLTLPHKPSEKLRWVYWTAVHFNSICSLEYWLRLQTPRQSVNINNSRFQLFRFPNTSRKTQL